MSHRKLLWQHVRLPQWDADRLYRLFAIHVAGTPTEAEREEYACQLMVLISANMGRRNWMTSLRRHRLDPEDVASDILSGLVQRTPGIALSAPCTAVLLSVLNVAIYRRLVSAVRQQTHVPEELPEWLAERIGGPCAAEMPSLDELRREMRQAEDRICAGPWKDQISVCVLYRYLCRQVMRRNTILAHGQLPEKLRERTSLEQHAAISYRLNKLIREYAAAGA